MSDDIWSFVCHNILDKTMKDYEKYLDIIFDITFDLAVRHDILLYNLPCDYFSANHRAENLPGQPIYICIP